MTAQLNKANLTVTCKANVRALNGNVNVKYKLHNMKHKRICIATLFLALFHRGWLQSWAIRSYNRVEVSATSFLGVVAADAAHSQLTLR